MKQPRRDESRSFLGSGWALPLRFEDTDGSVAMASLEQDVQEAIYIILGTNRGERVMRPEFGAGLGDFLFQPVTATTKERIRTRVQEALIDWEPRIDVTEVKVQDAAGDRSRLEILVSYRIRATNALHNFVYPFYLEEGVES